jgi:4-diphosphocytidyl-2-C-methyl-D-erythritol kinase
MWSLEFDYNKKGGYRPSRGVGIIHPKRGEMVLGVEKAYPKINIFLKITGADGEYHLIKSRMKLVRNFYDTIEIREGPKFNIFANEVNCVLRENSVFLAYYNLIKRYPEFREWFIGKEIHIRKQIPEMAGLGGGSSDAAAFLRLVNRLGGFGLSKEELAEIGQQVGSDVPFFIYGYETANVSGRGEIIEPFEEEELEFEILTPPIECATGEVYRYYRYHLFNPSDPGWEKVPTVELLANYSPSQLNDLLPAALALCPDLYKYKDWGFMSGSGSSFFRLKGEI